MALEHVLTTPSVQDHKRVHHRRAIRAPLPLSSQCQSLPSQRLRQPYSSRNHGFLHRSHTSQCRSTRLERRRRSRTVQCRSLDHIRRLPSHSRWTWRVPSWKHIPVPGLHGIWISLPDLRDHVHSVLQRRLGVYFWEPVYWRDEPGTNGGIC